MRTTIGFYFILLLVLGAAALFIGSTPYESWQHGQALSSHIVDYYDGVHLRNEQITGLTVVAGIVLVLAFLMYFFEIFRDHRADKLIEERRRAARRRYYKRRAERRKKAKEQNV